MGAINGRFLACVFIFVTIGAVFCGPALAEIEKGDLVKVNYTAKLASGEVFYSTNSDAVKGAVKTDWFKLADNPGPELVIAGQQAMFPGLGENLVGLAEGGTKTVTLKPEQAFGPGDPEKTRSFPREVVFPIDMEMGPREYVGRFNKFPVQDAEVEVNPYIKAEVKSITEDKVNLKLSAENGKVAEDEFGKSTITVTESEIKLFMDPQKGAKVPGVDPKGQPMQGRITTIDEESFVVDYNQPLLGQTIILDIEVAEVIEDSSLDNAKIVWSEADAGNLDEYKGKGKPIFVVMHRDGCGWCTKYFNETLKDKRILTLRDEFVWVKVDTQKHRALGEKYDLEGTPLTVILDDNGKELARYGGYKQAAVLYPVLDGLAGK